MKGSIGNVVRIGKIMVKHELQKMETSEKQASKIQSHKKP